MAYPPPIVFALSWNNIGERESELGIDRCVLYVDGLDGVAWNGITSVVESPSGGEARPYYIDGVKYLNLSASEEFAGFISAFYSPAEFDLCDGSIALTNGVFARQQVRRPFCFSFRTKVANDVDGLDHGYKIHIVYNAMATPAARQYASLAEETEVSVLTWNITTRPIPFPGLQPTAHITIDSRTSPTYALRAIEKILYGSELEDARVPMPDEIYTIFTTPPPFVVTSLSGSTFSLDGPEGTVDILDANTFQATADAIVMIDGAQYSATSP